MQIVSIFSDNLLNYSYCAIWRFDDAFHRRQAHIANIKVNGVDQNQSEAFNIKVKPRIIDPISAFCFLGAYLEPC